MRQKTTAARNTLRIVFIGIALASAYSLLTVRTGRADYDDDTGIRYIYQYSYSPLETGQFRLYYTGTYGTQESGDYILPTSTYLQQMGVSYGVTEHFDIEVYSTMLTGQAGNVNTPYTGGGSFRYYHATGYLDVAGLVDYHNDWTRTSMAQLTLILSKTIGRWNITGNGTAQHAFAKDRDAADLHFDAGASYMVNRYFNFGLEASVMDIEAAFEPDEAQGGTSLIISPVLVFTPEKDVNILVGFGFEDKNGITSQMVRGNLTMTF